MSQEETQAIQALKDIAMEGLKEQRRARRWGIFFKLFFIVYLLVFVVALFGINTSDNKLTTADEITAVVDIDGVIMDGAMASADLVLPGLKSAFENEKTKGIILRINSPGGSPVQAGIINDEIRRLKAERRYPGICGGERPVCFRWLLHCCGC